MSYKEECVNKNYLFEGKIIKVRCDDVLAKGGMTKREVVEHKGGSCILCEKEGKILLVRQYRYSVDEFLWELPAGKKEEGEDPKLTAIRELEEEGGIKAEDAKLLFCVYPTPGYDNEKIYIYQAEGISEGKVSFDEDEDIETAWFTREELKKMIDGGEITDGKTLIALLKII